MADNDGWELLRQIAAEVGERQLEKECREALEQEQEHLEKVRGWLLDMTIEEAAGVIAEGAEIEDSGIDGGADQKSRTMKKTRAKAKTKKASKARKRKKK